MVTMHNSGPMFTMGYVTGPSNTLLPVGFEPRSMPSRALDATSSANPLAEQI